MPIIGESPASRIEAVVFAVDAPHVTSTVIAAKVAPADVPKRSSLPSRLPRCWSTGKPCDCRQAIHACRLRRRRIWQSDRSRAGVRGKAWVRLQRVEVDGPHDRADHQHHHHGEDNPACCSRPSIRPYISTSANGNSIMATQDNQFVSAVGFSNGWALFMP